jgi:hypothetical protein
MLHACREHTATAVVIDVKRSGCNEDADDAGYQREGITWFHFGWIYSATNTTH